MKHLSQHPRKNVQLALLRSLVGLSLPTVLALATSAQAATLCVDQHHKPGCVSTISAAVAAAAQGDTIKVDSGIYKEDIVIGKTLSLVGADRSTTIIDASGLSNGVYVDGWDNNNLDDVIVTGFTVENANFEGILVNDADSTTIFGNIVRHNDRSLQTGNAVCPGLPAFETSEGNDCGEGIHLMGVVHSTVADNLVEQNAGGILISDETTTSHDNLITRNQVQNNDYACGITLASHPAYIKPGAPQGGTPSLAYGIYNNDVFENDSLHNGFGIPHGGAGVGLFAPGGDNRTYANSVVGNRLIGNSMSGIAVHNHVNLNPGGRSNNGVNNPDVSRNSLVGNYIAGNGSDPDVPTTASTGISVLGVSPIIDLMITNNVIEDEDIAVAFNSASTLEIHLNDFDIRQVGIVNVNPLGNVNARENWWGCSGGPAAGGCATVQGPGPVIFTPWLTRPVDGLRGHGLDRFFEFIHQYDCDRDDH
jgi:parallel beta-helix repeat protein